MSFKDLTKLEKIIVAANRNFSKNPLPYISLGALLLAGFVVYVLWQVIEKVA